MTTITQLETGINNLAGAFAEELNALETKMDTQQGVIEGQNSVISGLQGLVQSLMSQVNYLSGNYTELAGRVDTHNISQTELDKRISDVQSQAKENTEKSKQIVSDISSLNTQFETLSSRLEETAGQVTSSSDEFDPSALFNAKRKKK